MITMIDFWLLVALVCNFLVSRYNIYLQTKACNCANCFIITKWNVNDRFFHTKIKKFFVKLIIGIHGKLTSFSKFKCTFICEYVSKYFILVTIIISKLQLEEFSLKTAESLRKIKFSVVERYTIQILSIDSEILCTLIVIIKNRYLYRLGKISLIFSIRYILLQCRWL